MSSAPELWAIIVTYHRPNDLRVMLEAAARQTRPPDHVVVVDNGSDAEARLAAESAGATYLDAGDNLGPAGGVALAMEHILALAGEHDWVVSLDDDDPPPADDLIEAVWNYGQERLAADRLTAGVGCHGADYDHRLGVFRRLHDDELNGDILVAVVGGPFLPMYRCTTIRQLGTFDKDLFFGFEEGEFGLRIRRAGLHLYVQGDMAKRIRTLLYDTEKLPKSPRTAAGKAGWRRYYSIRNSTLLAWRHASPIAPWYTALGGAAKGTVALARAKRPAAEVLLPLRGAIEGLLRHSGRTLNPASSTK